jgi:hypothetical protein
MSKVYASDGSILDPNFLPPGDPEANLIKRLEALSDFDCQARIMVRLIELGFLAREMGTQNYMRFLKKLLRLRLGQDVRCAICVDIARMSQTTKDREMLAAEGVIELLLVLLKSKDEIIVSSCGRALVNLCAESTDNKKKICGGTEGSKNVRSILQHLASPSEELQMVFAKLLKNLASEEQFNKQFGTSGANKILSRVLAPPVGIPPIGMPIAKLDELRVAICAAVWKLAEIPSNRDTLIVEKAHKSVVDILKETENEDVIEKAAGALMVLGTHPDESVKEDCLNSDAVQCLVAKLEMSKGKLAVRNVVAALLVLTSEKKNLEVMMSLKEAINEQLTNLEGLIATEKQLESFVDHLQTRLASN